MNVRLTVSVAFLVLLGFGFVAAWGELPMTRFGLIVAVAAGVLLIAYAGMLFFTGREGLNFFLTAAAAGLLLLVWSALYIGYVAYAQMLVLFVFAGLFIVVGRLSRRHRGAERDGCSSAGGER